MIINQRTSLVSSLILVPTFIGIIVYVLYIYSFMIVVPIIPSSHHGLESSPGRQVKYNNTGMLQTHII